MKSNSRFLIVVFAFCFVVSLIGCQKNKLAPVTGTVSLDGKPVENAKVYLTPVGGGDGAATGEADAAGHFTLRLLKGGETGAIPGEYIVTVKKIISVDTGKTQPDLYDPSKRMPLLDSKNEIPEKYNSIEKPLLKATIVAGKNPPIDLQLKSK
ncbi:MAG: hypothetical protein PHQ75_12640 [Thermoguttaceae bacterium]|nr:hypothetical protein [Thermoguttaceae bacterium]